MLVAGFWRRFFCQIINIALSVLTVGIYLVFWLIAFLSGKSDIGMKITGLSWSSRRPLRFLLFLLLGLLFNCIPFIGLIELIRVCLKKGTWAENWSGTFIVLTSSMEQQPQYYINVKK